MGEATKGPWEARSKTTKTGTRWTVAAPGTLGGRASLSGFKVLWDVANGRPTDDEPAEANARLIAAAPELRDALESALAWIKEWAPPVQDDEWPDEARAELAAMRAAASAALAKARNETNAERVTRAGDAG